MAEKHIFIGLGGSGVNTVSLLKNKIYERMKGTEMKTRLQVMNETYRFIFVDTDSRDVARANEKYRDLYEGGKINFINDVELFNLGDINPYICFHEAANHPELKINRRMLEACPPELAETMENRDLSFGAGAFRMKSRIAFGRKEGDFIDKLRTSINDLNQVEIDNAKNVIHYWVVASSNGGTGSGTVQDVLYLVNMLHRTHIDKGNPKVGLILYMPRIYINKNSDNNKYPSNAYAVFKEIEAFQKWAKESPKNLLFHRMAMVDDYTMFDEKMAYRPFEFCIPVDFHTENNNNMGDIDKMYSNTAELIFYIHSGAGASGFKSFLDNNQEQGGGQTLGSECFLIPMGYMALRKPDEQFENYIALRSKYEMLRYGILGSPIESSDKRREVTTTLFKTVITDTLFAGGAGKESYFHTIKGLVTEMIEDEMPRNRILNDKNKVMKKLPANVSIEDARSVISAVEAAISRRSEEKNNTKKAIEEELWRWTEDNARKWGLQYVKDVLQELDALCTNLYMAYTTDTNTAVLGGLCSSRKALVDNRASIESELDDLYQNALKTTAGEFFTGSNSGDVERFYNRLIEWVQASVNVILTEEAFGMIYELTYGDHGIIDRIITHVRKLVTEASAVLTGDKGAAHGYSSLAKLFYTTKLDVTSVFVPDITEFVNGNGWREDNNLFSEWYGMVIGHTSDYVPGEGFTPLRNGDSAHSLEGIFSQMITYYNEKMIQEKYVIGKDSHLFTNTHKNDFRRTVEDLLDYTVGTVKMLIRQNTTISNQWYEKTLSQFFSDLNNEARRSIQQKTQPTVFFPYIKSMRSSRITDKAFCVGPTGVVENVFLQTASAGKTEFIDNSDNTVMYKIATKLGLSFEYYDMYQSVKNEYDKCQNKAYCHFHQSFATSGGDADNIKLPREIRPEQIDFTKYLIMNQMRNTFSHLYVKGTEVYNLDHYTETPVIFDSTKDKIVKFATSAALKMIDNEKIELQVTDGDTEYFHTVSIDHPEHRMTELLAGFTDFYTIGRFAVLASDLAKDLNFLESDTLRQNYQETVECLKSKLNEQWSGAGKKEKETIGDILRILNERLDTVTKFLSNKYEG